MKIGIALVIVVMLQGCVMHQQITDDAVAYNKSVERMQNELILLNVVRAMHRRPMHFTSLSLIRGNLRTSVDGSLKIPFGGGGTTTSVTGNVGGSYSSNPSFDVAVLDSEKFMRGIMTPVNVDTFSYYWSQGWPKEILVSLFVREIVLTHDDIVTVYENYPDNITKYEEFQIAIKDCEKWKFESYYKDEIIGPELDVKAVRDFALLTKAYTAGLRVEKIKKPAEVESDEPGAEESDEPGEEESDEPGKEKVDEPGKEKVDEPGKEKVVETDKYNLIKRVDLVRLVGPIAGLNVNMKTYKPGTPVPDPTDTDTKAPDSTDTDTKAPDPTDTDTKVPDPTDTDTKAPDSPDPDKQAPESPEPDKMAMESSGGEKKREAILYIRSPEAIIYHLGELLRAQQNHPDFPHLKLSEYDPYQKKWIDARLFVAYQDTMHESAIVRVNYEGKDYIIPIADPEDLEAGPGRSMHCLTLVLQLLALHKSSEEMPTTSAVTLIGR